MSDVEIAKQYRFPCHRCGKRVRGDKLKPLALGHPLPIVRVCESCFLGSVREEGKP